MSNTQKKNVPELRFPGFEGTWEEKQLGESMKVLKSGLSRELSNTDIGLPVIRANNIDGYNLKLDNIKYWYKNDPKGANTSNYLLKKGDILVNFINSEAKMGTTCIILNELERDTIYTTNILRYVTKTEYDAYFHYLITQTYNYKKGIKLITKPAVNQASFTTVDFKKIPYNLPEIEEQQKIGQFFRKIDCQIELEEQKLELLQQQKKGYMQKIFSQELRFKDENGNEYPEWEETTIKEIAQINTGKKDTKDAVTNGSYDFYVRSPLVYKINTFSYEGEAILTVGDGVGVGKVFHYVNGKFDYHQRVYKISDFKNYYGLLLFYYFSQNFLKETKKYSAKTSVDSVRKDMVANMKVPLPIYIEQQKIGQFFKKLDNKIKIQKQVIELLKQRKKTLLQKMFI
ncbi:restriction endonuclease subunit S [Staphylococcus schweitzeri]|uniref:restriction endonuclease subunit S n=1 Tax=Staphylococcus schweitzeri TaxID=1654388 RepID=UPI0005087D5B|nr:restriction endonuclease subunit S [Staphylococcus schweitzeri]CDR66725.1 Type I restriction-modification system%2C specificity subunit S [Staphylococcus schweitzeri]